MNADSTGGDPASAGVPARTLTTSVTLAPDLTSVRAARIFVRRQCQDRGVAAEDCDTVVLLTSETVTNAFTHGRSEARVSVTVSTDRVRVEVGDDNSRHPKHVTPDADALDGRGLTIVRQLATGWGVRDEPYGKTVWFEVDVG